MIHHELHGTSSNPLLIFTHGIGEHSGLYQSFKDYLVEEGFCVLLYDLRGHGQSDGLKPYKRYDIFLEDLHELVSKYKKPNQKVFLIGQSLGALISNAYMCKYHDVDGIVSLGYQYDYLSKVRLFGFLFPNKVLKLNWTDPRSRHVKHDSDINDPLLLKQIEFRWLYQTLIKANQLIHKHAGMLKTDILLLHGGQDVIVETKNAFHYYESLKAANKEIIIYPNSKHDILLDVDKLILYKDIVEWLKSK